MRLSINQIIAILEAVLKRGHELEDENIKKVANINIRSFKEFRGDSGLDLHQVISIMIQDSFNCAKAQQIRQPIEHDNLLRAVRQAVSFYDQHRPKISLLNGYPDPSAYIENMDKYFATFKNAIAQAKGDIK